MAVYINTRIDASTRKYALLGAQLPYTWSPQIHNSLFDAKGINAVYLPITVSADSLASAMDVLRQCFQGFNVTIPYKEAVIPFLDELDPVASACGAVNTVTVGEDGCLTGYITDGMGLVRALEEAWVALEAIDVLVIGGGGTARVAAYEMLRRENRVTIAVRNPLRAEKLLSDLIALQPDREERVRLISLDVLEHEDNAYDLMLHATPLGMHPNENSCAVSEDVVARCSAVLDAVYNPPESRLLETARKQGAKTINGYGMLFYQAVEAQRKWLGSAPPTRTLREIRKALEALL